MTAVLAHDAVHGGEPEPGAFALLFGREEGLEHARARRGVHTGAGIADGEEDIRARLGIDVLLGVRAVDLHLVRFDGEDAAVRHGIAGVDGEVQEHLVNLRRISTNRSQLRCQDRGELDLLSDQPAQHLVRVGDDLVQAQGPRLDRLPAAEGQELAGEVAGALGRAADLLEILAVGTVGREVEQHQIRVAENRRQDVVEVVGHAAGQGAEGVHLLRLPQLLFELLALGDVDDGAFDHLLP